MFKQKLYKSLLIKLSTLYLYFFQIYYLSVSKIVSKTSWTKIPKSSHCGFVIKYFFPFLSVLRRIVLRRIVFRIYSRLWSSYEVQSISSILLSIIGKVCFYSISLCLHLLCVTVQGRNQRGDWCDCGQFSMRYGRVVKVG